ncbi:hypothetical protein JT05_06265, partial [Desulfosporosinus sp. Tol-M]
QGIQGTQGIQGATGATGTLSSAYAWIYNTGAQTVAVGGNFNFDSNGILLGIQHTAGSPIITITNSGIYMLTYQVSATGSNQVSVFLSGNRVTGSRFGITQPVTPSHIGVNYGQVIFTAANGATATLTNNFSTDPIVLATGAGGTGNTSNASIVIHRIN